MAWKMRAHTVWFEQRGEESDFTSVKPIAAHRVQELLLSKQGSTPTPWARGLRDQIQKWALQTQKTLDFQGFCTQRGIQTMVSEGARPWGRGRSGDCELPSVPKPL